jgi:hypothetical protein
MATRYPLRLEVDSSGHRLGHQKPIEFRITAFEGELKSVTLEGTLGCNDEQFAVKPVRNLRPGESVERRHQWMPDCAGVVAIELKVCVGERHSAANRVFAGAVKVAIAPAEARGAAPNVNLTIQGSKVMGVDRLMTFNSPLDAPGPPVPAVLPPSWVVVDLVEEEQHHLVDLGRSARPVSAARLTADGPQRHQIDIVSMPVPRFGRRHGTNDIVLRFLLTDGLDDEERSTGISRDHFELSLDASAPGPTLKPRTSANTQVDGRAIGRDESSTLPCALSTCVVTVGMAGLELGVRAFPASGTADDTAAWQCITESKAPDRPASSFAACRIHRCNNAPEIEYCWLVSEATLGNGADCVIHLHGEHVAHRHARLLFWQGRYYLENLLSAPHLAVDDRPVEPYEIVVLGETHRLRFGQAVYRWELPV